MLLLKRGRGVAHICNCPCLTDMRLADALVINVALKYYWSTTDFHCKLAACIKRVLIVWRFCRAMLCIARLLPACGARLSVRLFSVCLSVRLSDTFVSCAETNKDIFEIFSPCGSQSILVFPYQTGWRYSNGNPPNGGVECKGGMNNGRFSTNVSLYLRNGYS